jgi:hypothetical protein
MIQATANPNPNQPKNRTRLPARLDKHLLAYAAAATAAGVGLLAFTPSAQVKVVYTPANIPIPIDGGLVQLNVNNDGVADFA